jgi:hypothetical protein
MKVVTDEKEAIEECMNRSFLMRRQVRRCLDIAVVMDDDILKVSFVHGMVILGLTFGWNWFTGRPLNAKPFAVPSLAFSIAFTNSLTLRISLGSSVLSSDTPTKPISFLSSRAGLCAGLQGMLSDSGHWKHGNAQTIIFINI